MARGKPVSDDLRASIVRQYTAGLSVFEILAHTGVSERQIYRVLADYKVTGSSAKPPKRETRGRHLYLRPEEIQFIQGLVNDNCDIYLDELQEALSDVVGAKTSLTTVFKTLHQEGYSFKKVCVPWFLLKLLDIIGYPT
ncbi:hypothetical protein FISHEDRAFT_32829 [Fistulina hepatica ATCC 64428]|uniref:Homeodomain-like protein n=1 Tax=Fistulina hepatica ATCC 64428 TaxID=1128425 RepID=A0A0D7APN8_9AGAR|nr:hypothetical protein FISHEDRAFT_32829 [Fistulina hepatica ATCC 64428]